MIDWNERNLRLRVSDGWEQIVVEDGYGEDYVLIEGHHLDAEDVLFALGYRFEIEEYEPDYEEPDDLEMGFDPYMGCYSDDC